MTKPKLVTVKAIDIKTGKKSIPCKCPIALAVCRAMRLPVGEVSVMNEIVVGSVWFKLTKKADRFIERFDSGQSVKPFSFYLRRA